MPTWRASATSRSPTPTRSTATRLEQAFAGLDVVYWLVHSLGGGADYADRDRAAATNAAAAAAAAGVSRIVYLGGLGEAGEGLSEHLRSRHETAEVAGRRPGAGDDPAGRHDHRLHERLVPRCCATSRAACP